MDVDLELKMKISRRKLRVLLLHEFCLSRKATEAPSTICSPMGKNVLFMRTAQHWFNRFKNGSFEIDDLLHSGRPLEVEMDVLRGPPPFRGFSGTTRRKFMKLSE